MIRKHNKPDASKPNAYRPITLEETLGKLLEKMISNRLQWLATDQKLLSPRQYGTRVRSSVIDAGLDLTSKIEHAKASNLFSSLLMVDVSGFFPSIQHHLLHHELTNLGIPSAMVQLISSFLSNRQVSLCFDGYSSPLQQVPNLGVPQGSPLSPILSALYAAPALDVITDGDVFAYVDDHSILFTCPKTVDGLRSLRARQSAQYDLLDRAFKIRGCALDGPKTELIDFFPCSTLNATPTALWRSASTIPHTGKFSIPELLGPLPLKMRDGSIQRINPQKSIRWLGIQLDNALTFTTIGLHFHTAWLFGLNWLSEFMAI
jgi:hypothetical protein